MLLILCSKTCFQKMLGRPLFKLFTFLCNCCCLYAIINNGCLLCMFKLCGCFVILYEHWTFNLIHNEIFLWACIALCIFSFVLYEFILFIKKKQRFSCQQLHCNFSIAYFSSLDIPCLFLPWCSITFKYLYFFVCRGQEIWHNHSCSFSRIWVRLDEGNCVVRLGQVVLR